MNLIMFVTFHRNWNMLEDINLQNVLNYYII